MTDLSELSVEQRLRVQCIDFVLEAQGQEGGYAPSPRQIVAQAQILEDHIMQNDKRDGGDEDTQYVDEAEKVSDYQNPVNEYAETAQQSPQDFFRTELKRLLNSHSIDNELNTPDWLLADTLTRFIDTLWMFQHELAKWELESGRARIEPETKFIRRPGSVHPFGGI